MVKNNRTNEQALRDGLTEKARLTAEHVARESVEEAEREERMGIHDGREDTNES